MRIKHTVAVALFSCLMSVASAPASASDKSAAVAAAHQFIDGFNVGNTKSALAACAPSTSIVDEFAPHMWSGPGACARWADAYNANASANGITDGFVTLEAPWEVDVKGDIAYVVFPAKYAYQQHGKPVLENGSVFAVVLHKMDGSWRIVSWTWAEHPAST